MRLRPFPENEAYAVAVQIEPLRAGAAWEARIFCFAISQMWPDIWFAGDI
jgi:hypothetical protein